MNPHFPEELLKRAALGTGQAADDVPATATALDRVLVQLDDDRPEAKLLLTAAAISLRTRAGFQPGHDHRPPPPPAPPDAAVPCSPEVLAFFDRMLAGEHEEVIEEWLREVAAARLRVPEYALPRLLNLGREHEHLREQILPVIGERGRWLARQVTNQNWNWFDVASVDDIWQKKKSDVRRQLFNRLRQHDPQRVIVLLQRDWHRIKPDRQREFVELLQTNLSMDDESFLESCLDDAAVRPAAAELLTHLPDSRLVNRMKTRAMQHVKLERLGPSPQWTIQMTPPADADAALLRDGVDPQHPDPEDNTTVGMWLLHQILRCVPPAFWCAHWGISRLELVETIERSREALTYIEGWVAAAERFGDAEFAEWLLRSHFVLNFLQSSPLVQPLARVLSPEQREAIAIEWLQRSTHGVEKQTHPVIVLLSEHQQIWSEALMRAFLANLEQYLSKRERPFMLMQNTLMGLALYFPPEMRDEILTVIDVETGLKGVWHEFVHRVDDLLTFRAAMLAAIAASRPSDNSTSGKAASE